MSYTSRGAQYAQFLVPKTEQQQRAERPFATGQKPAGAAKDIVIEILFEEAASDQDIYQRIEQPRAGHAVDAVAIAWE
jgi:hypothetical protein